MQILDLIQFYASAFLAEFIGTIGGFGSATIFTPLATLLLDIKTAIVLISFFHIAGSLTRTVYFFKHINWRIFGWFIITDIALTILGASLLSSAPSTLIEIIFGVFLVLYGGLHLLWPKREFNLKPHAHNLLIWGGISGFLAGLLGTGGAARTAALQSFKLHKREYLGTSGLMAVITDMVRLPIYLSASVIIIDQQNISLAAGLVVVAIIAALAGSRVADKLPEGIFRKFIYLLLFAAGVYFLI